MSREKQEITMWKYPYTARDGIKNIREYGINSALSHDWERTKEAMESRLEKAALGVISGLVICVAIPVGMYQGYKIIREINKRKKQLENSDI